MSQPSGKPVFSCSDAVAVIDGKKVKGTLVILSDGYSFSGRQCISGLFDICEVRLLDEDIMVPGLFGSRSKPGVKIVCSEKHSASFVLSEDDADDLIDAVASAADAECKRRNEELYIKLCGRMENIAASAEAEALSKEFAALASYKDSERRAGSCRELAKKLKKQEEEYTRCCSLMRSGSAIDGYAEAARSFKAMGSYRDAAELCAQCEQKAEQLRLELYNRSCIILSGAMYQENIDRAIDGFKKLGAYRDAADKLAESNKRKGEIIANERKYSDAAARMRKADSIAEYAELERIFLSIGLYKESSGYAKDCRVRKEKLQQALRARVLTIVASAEGEEDVAKAEALLGGIGDYPGLDKLLLECSRKRQEILLRKEQQYKEANALFGSIRVPEDAKKVYDIFHSLGKYLDAEEKAGQCLALETELHKKEQTYIKAKRLLDAVNELGDIDSAIGLFAGLGDYRDAQALLASAKDKRAGLVERMYTEACGRLKNARALEPVKEAIASLELISGYKDAKSVISEARRLYKELEDKEAVCKKADAILENATTLEGVDEALALYWSVSGYDAVKPRLDKCERKKAELKKGIYDTAKSKLAFAKIPYHAECALKLFKSIDDYGDAKQQISICQETLRRLNEKEAVYRRANDGLNAAKSAADYEAVLASLASIKGYRDADALTAKCAEKIRQLKEIEERERREAEERARLAAEKKAQIDAIENAWKAPDAVEQTKGKITKLNRRALNCFLENPFRILGISRNADVADAQAVLDKFKKLERLKALGSYSAPYSLKHFSKPDRSSAVIQAAIGTLEDIGNRILWFATPVGGAAWCAAEYRELTQALPGVEYDSYDVFLANYIYAVLNDAEFSNAALWTGILKRIAALIKAADTRGLFKGADTTGDFDSLFEKQVSEPVVDIIEDSDITGLKNLYAAVSGIDGIKNITAKLDSCLSKWFETETRAIDKEISELGDGENATAYKAVEAKSLYARLKTGIKPQLSWAEQHYPAKSVRLTMFRDEYRGTAWSLMVFLFKAGHKADARGIADDIEAYCNDEQKDILKYVIREVPRPRPKPVPPEHEHYDLGWVFIGYGEIKVVEVTLNFSANVYLLDDSDFDDYLNCRNFSYYGGRPTQTPYRIKIPNSGHWHLVVDDGPGGLGGVRSSARIQTISNNYYY